jgi:hypothetical protein
LLLTLCDEGIKVLGLFCGRAGVEITTAHTTITQFLRNPIVTPLLLKLTTS